MILPDTIDKYVSKGNPVRFIDAFVDCLNLENLGFKHSIPADTGRPSTFAATSTRLDQAENWRKNATAMLQSCGCTRALSNKFFR